jgi:hypothetical protein
MKTTIFIFLCYLLTYYGCDNEVESYPQIEGKYKGTYTRIEYIGSDHASTDEGSVILEFTDRTFTCVPDVRWLPPTGAGIYSFNYKKIILTDTIVHTAEFDWTLILGGAFNYSYDGTNLTLIQNDLKHKRRHTINLTKKIE